MTEEEPFVIRDKRRNLDGGGNEEESAQKDEVQPSELKAKEKTPEETISDNSGGEPKKAAPEINFSAFILSLSSSAAMALGGYQDPLSGHVPKNLQLAKQSIDILGVLEEKTRGNLNAEEEKLITSALYELRMSYVEEVKKGK